MRISYDSEVDAMYVQLVEGDQQCRTVRLSDDIALDFGAGEVLVGIEILDAKRVLGKGKLPKLVLDNIALVEVPPLLPAPPRPASARGSRKGTRPIRKAG